MYNTNILKQYLANPLFDLIPSKRFNKELEAQYREFELTSHIQMFRSIAVLGMFLYGGFYIADVCLIESGLKLHQIIRLMIVLPFSILVLALSFKKFFYTNRFYVEGAIVMSLISGQIFHLIMAYMPTTPDHYYFIITLALVLWGNSFPILSLGKKILFTVINLIILIMYLYYLQKSPVYGIIFQSIAYTSIMIVSLLSAYLIERNRRINFLSALKLKENASGFNQVAQLTSHELKTSMRIIHGLSYIIEKNEEDNLSQKSKENLTLLREQILELNDNLEHLKDRAKEHH